MSDQSTCWACGEIIEESIVNCPNCGMPVNQEDSSDVDLDALMQEVTEAKPEEISEAEAIPEPLLPDMDYIEGKTDISSSPKSELDEAPESDAPILPDMDYVSGEKEQSATPAGEMDLKLRKEELETPSEPIEQGPEMLETLSEQLDQITKEESVLEEPEELTEEVESIADPSITVSPEDDLEKKVIVREEVEHIREDIEVVEEEVPVVEAKKSIFTIGAPKFLYLHLSQWIYWAGVFYLISFASFELISPNVGVGNLGDSQFEIHPEAFIFSWLSFFGMAWFYAYKLRIENVDTKWYYSLFYLIGLYIMLNVIYFLYISILNFFTSPSEPLLIYTVPINIMLFTSINYIISGITAGFFLFFVGYSLAWENIYRRTPMYELRPNLVE